MHDWLHIQRFELRRHGLSSLVSTVAIYLDSAIRERCDDDSSILHLSKLLEDLTKENSYVPIDVGALFLFAIPGRENAEKYWKGREKKEYIVEEVKQIAGNLKNYKNLSKEKIEKLTDFCNRLYTTIIEFQDECYYRHRLVG